ncbi:MAG TPA: methylated-DNA--[protein]-cysteine S-methyltransferase [Candidatus Nanopelagicales bacterium]|jgi:methylated-DNA-[protein]-cysteine S-methyltransferase|nr:methylated-DNA--[protein]-cysteine S-methyltransferase [Candidatus Nanopelagicales bacterium]
MSALLTAVLPTPAGDLAVIVDPDDGAVVASGFSSIADQQSRLPADEQRRATVATTDGAMRPVADAVAAYAEGDLGALDAVAVRQPGGPFLQGAWQALREVKAGDTATYTELAAGAGNPRAVRAAGSACARNLVAPFVPCHRIVRTDGTLGGYYYGLAVKTALLRHEHALAEDPALFS